MITREAIERLLVDCGHAINRLNGRCGIAETVLCRVTTLCTELLGKRAEDGTAPGMRPEEPTLTELLNDLKHRGGGACIHTGLLGQEGFAIVVAIGDSAKFLERFYESEKGGRITNVQYPDTSANN